MIRNQILVRKIKHLTDARYFAAMGVDWMSMELNNDPTSFMKWHTLKDWVEGVQLAAEIGTPDEMLVAKTIIDAKPEGIILTQLIGIDELSDVELFFDTHYIDRNKCPAGSFEIIHFDEIDTDRIPELSSHTTFLQHEWTPDVLELLLAGGYEGGICFSGGEEDATGMRDYEAMDELLALILK
ncbi:MAG: hypothetical protein KBA14_07695 [Saprospiraceae bacterium]|nr:hypothetical protein [Saprospiraceae bacterium]